MDVQKIYLACIIIGIVLLLCSILSNVVEGFFDFAAFDMFSVDIGDFDIDILPISMRSLCLAATVFGSVSMLLPGQPMLYRHAIAGVCAYLGAFIVQNITGFLKSHQSEAESLESICSRNYVVNIPIPEKGYGSVASAEPNRSVITLTAKSLDGDAIAAGTDVTIVNIAEHVAIVIPKKHTLTDICKT